MSRAGGHLGRGTARPACGQCACRGLAGCQRQCRGARLAPRRLIWLRGSPGRARCRGAWLAPRRLVARPCQRPLRGRARTSGRALCGRTGAPDILRRAASGARLGKRRARHEYAAALGGSEVGKRAGGAARRPNSPAGASAGRPGPRQHRQRRAAFRQTSQGASAGRPGPRQHPSGSC